VTGFVKKHLIASVLEAVSAFGSWLSLQRASDLRWSELERTCRLAILDARELGSITSASLHDPLEFQMPSAKLDSPFIGTTSGGGDLLLAAELTLACATSQFLA
jgi:hypothetical protein